MKNLTQLGLTSVVLAAALAGNAYAQPRVNGNSKGSLVIFPHVEVRWNEAGDTVILDTFIHLSNDFPSPVDVKLYFVNGDPPISAPARWDGGDPPSEDDADVLSGLVSEIYTNEGHDLKQGGGGDGGDRDHLGWNFYDNILPLRPNAAGYWAASTGDPAGVGPWTQLDPGPPPGRPDPDNPGERYIRGFVIAFAIRQTPTADEIKWNHLYGDATVVRYNEDYAWQYHAYTFDVVAPVNNGDPTGIAPGELRLDGVEYDEGFDLLQLNFVAAGSEAYIPGMASDTLLSLMPITMDFRDGAVPVTTHVSFDIWNENEVKFTNLDQCVTCWSGLLLTQHQTPNHFLMSALHTDIGKARMDAEGSAQELCGPDLTVDAVSILGLAARFSGMGYAGAKNLVGLGTEEGLIQYTPSGPPPESRQDQAAVSE